MANKKEPWEEYPHIWRNKTAFFTYLRGALRKAVWNRWPGKLEFKKESGTPPPPGYTGRAKNLGTCALTGERDAISRFEVDHIQGNVSLRSWEDVLPFILHLCASKDNMQLVTKEAHKIKSLAEKRGINFQDAKIAKDQINFGKKDEATQRGMLQTAGIAPEDISATKAGRVRQYKQLTTKETTND